MHSNQPPHSDFTALLELPSVPFAHTAGVTLQADQPVASGTSVSELLDALQLDGLTMDADEIRPHAEFSAAVERRSSRTERRRKPRTTSDRRAFASTNLAMPEHGPEDPRPQTAPPASHVISSPAPIDPIMPPLPLELEPALPYELPSRGVAAGTLRTTRPNIAVNDLPFPATAIDHPVAPVGAPEPPTATVAPVAPVAPTALVEQVVEQQAPVQPAPTGTVPVEGIGAVFAGSAPIPVGRLEPFTTPDAAPQAPQTRAAGLAGPATAPGFGLDPMVAAVAATPTAWHGGAIQVDDAMLVWNAPGTNVPLAPSVAAMISPAPPSATLASAAAAPAIATTTLTPAVRAGAGPAGSRSPVASLLRLLLLVGLPASSGIGIALALDRFLF